MIKDIVELVNINKNYIKKVNKVDEIQNSVADINSLIKQIGIFKFSDLNSYIKNNVKNYKNRRYFYKNISNKNIKETGVVIYGGVCW